MIWKLLFVSLGFASAQDKIYVDPEYLDELWATGKDEEFAQLLDIKVDRVRSDKSEEGYARSKLSNGIHYLYGDMLLQNEQGINYLNLRDRRWPNGKIPCFISQKSYYATQRQTIIDAIEDFNSMPTNLKIVPYRRHKDYVFIFNGKGCLSAVGKGIYQQPLILSEGCLQKGIIQHEIMHAAGFHHEHNRSDRDEYVEVLLQNIPKDSHGHYNKSDSDASSSLGPYDYCSIMHYPLVEPDTRKPAFKILKNIDTSCMVHVKGPTDIDIQKINKLYS